MNDLLRMSTRLTSRLPRALSLLLLPLLTAAATAQQSASTLWRLCGSADAVAHATVRSVDEPLAGMLRIELGVVRLLHGQLPATFTLQEPAGRCCGRSLFSLRAGDQALVFLRRIGPTLHVLNGSRGVLPPSTALLTHTAQLLANRDPNAATHILATALTHDEPRIGDDAALALATMPGLQLTASERQRFTAALDEAVARGSTRTAALADIAVRIADAEVVDHVLPLYLGTRHGDQARLLRRALLRCPPTLLANRLIGGSRGAAQSALRTAELLARMPAEPARAPLQTLLRQRHHPQVQLAVCEALLADGMPRNNLEGLVPRLVLDLAVARRDRAPRYRNLTPQR